MRLSALTAGLKGGGGRQRRDSTSHTGSSLGQQAFPVAQHTA